jgi:hypothetical protein
MHKPYEILKCQQLVKRTDFESFPQNQSWRRNSKIGGSNGGLVQGIVCPTPDRVSHAAAAAAADLAAN